MSLASLGGGLSPLFRGCVVSVKTWCHRCFRAWHRQGLAYGHVDLAPHLSDAVHSGRLWGAAEHEGREARHPGAPPAAWGQHQGHPQHEGCLTPGLCLRPDWAAAETGPSGAQGEATRSPWLLRVLRVHRCSGMVPGWAPGYCKSPLISVSVHAFRAGTLSPAQGPGSSGHLGCGTSEGLWGKNWFVTWARDHDLLSGFSIASGCLPTTFLRNCLCSFHAPFSFVDSLLSDLPSSAFRHS